MVNGIDAEKETLQSLVRSCLLELNKLKFDLTQLEVEKANDNSASRIRELEQDIVDKEKEVERLTKEKARLEGEIKRVDGKLNNKGFVDKAPQNVVEEEKQKGIKYREMLNKVLESLKSFE